MAPQNKRGTVAGGRFVEAEARVAPKTFTGFTGLWRHAGHYGTMVGARLPSVET